MWKRFRLLKLCSVAGLCKAVKPGTLGHLKEDSRTAIRQPVEVVVVVQVEVSVLLVVVPVTVEVDIDIVVVVLVSQSDLSDVMKLESKTSGALVPLPQALTVSLSTNARRREEASPLQRPLQKHCPGLQSKCNSA